MGKRHWKTRVMGWKEWKFLYGFKPHIPKFHYSTIPAFEA
jgi:hypothetical protein